MSGIHPRHLTTRQVRSRAGVFGGIATVALTLTLALAVSSAGVAAGKATRAGPAVGVACTDWAKRDVRFSQRLGNRLCRVEFDITSRASAMDQVIGTYARAGIRVQPLAGFHGRMPTESDSLRLRTWATRFGPKGTFWEGRKRRVPITKIEFGNETSYSYQYGHSGTWSSSAELAERARTYALRLRTASVALRGTGVGLLAQAEDGEGKSPTWVDSMFDAVPDLARHVSGWTIHPYGEAGFAKIDRMIAHLAARKASASIPIYITEWGLATGDGSTLDKNYGYPTNMTYTQAASTLRSVMARWKTEYNGRIAQVIYYMLTDLASPGSTNDGEHFFGLLELDGSRKGQYTIEARTQITASTVGAPTRAPASNEPRLSRLRR